MNFIQMMHYAQYQFLIEKRDFGDMSNFAAKGTITGLLSMCLITILEIFGIKVALHLHNYLQVALFVSFPVFLIVNYFALSDEELNNEDLKEYRVKGKRYLDVFTFSPLVYMFYLSVKYTLYGA